MAVFAVAPLSEAWSSWTFGYSSEHTTITVSSGSLRKTKHNNQLMARNCD